MLGYQAESRSISGQRCQDLLEIFGLDVEFSAYPLGFVWSQPFNSEGAVVC